MPRLKARPELAQMEQGARPADVDSVAIVAAHADMTARHSPALALQADLEQAWNVRHNRATVPVTKIPFVWTLVGTSVVCAAFWYVILQLIF